MRFPRDMIAGTGMGRAPPRPKAGESCCGSGEDFDLSRPFRTGSDISKFRVSPFFRLRSGSIGGNQAV